MIPRLVVGAGVAFACVCTAGALAQSLTALGVPAGETDSGATGVSADGSVIVGWTSNGSRNLPFLWTQADGMQSMGLPGAGGTWALANGVSGDGSTIFGICDTASGSAQTGFQWRAATGYSLLPGLGDPLGAWPMDATYDGGIIVGQSSSPGFWGLPTIWLGGANPAAYPSGGFSGWAGGISGDGTVAAGTLETSHLPGGNLRLAVWTNGSLQVIGTLPGTDHAVFGGISADGTTVVGRATDGTGDDIAMIWRAGEGLKPLPRRPNTRYAWPLGVSGDGKIVVGWYDDHTTGVARAFVYKKTLGTTPLNLYLYNLGVDVTGWELSYATAVSADGTTIVGEGTYNGQYQAFVANIGVDTDEDGLLDDWEINGIPYTDAQGASRRYLLDVDEDGTIDANPLRKDLFVEVDAMSDVYTISQYLDPVVEAFDRAPVPAPEAPGGLPGVALHLQIAGTAFSEPFDDTWTDYFDYKSYEFGSNAEYNSPDRDALLRAKARAYRYCVYGRTHGSTPDEKRVSGIAEGIGCNDFMVTLEGWHLSNYPTAEVQDISAGTFMHELGHALGLRHGGGDDANYKPNYFSTMNYTWQTPNHNYASAGSSGVFRRFFPNYSSRVLATLDESALSETTPVDPGTPDPDLLYPYSIPLGATNCDALHACTASDNHAYCSRFAFFDSEVDWNNDCVTGPGAVSADINNLFNENPSPSEVLTGFDDWSNLVYDFKGSTYSLDGVTAPSPPSEIDVTTYERMRDGWQRPACAAITVPADATVCAADAITLHASVTGPQPATLRWQALSSTGRWLADLSDGPFVDAHTGLTYTAAGTGTDTLIVTGVALGFHPPSLRFGLRVTNPCGGTLGPSVAITVDPCIAHCDPDFTLDGNADQDDVAYLINVISGGDNPTGRDPDFTLDGNADQDDVSALINVVAGGACP